MYTRTATLKDLRQFKTLAAMVAKKRYRSLYEGCWKRNIKQVLCVPKYFRVWQNNVPGKVNYNQQYNLLVLKFYSHFTWFMTGKLVALYKYLYLSSLFIAKTMSILEKLKKGVNPIFSQPNILIDYSKDHYRWIVKRYLYLTMSYTRVMDKSCWPNRLGDLHIEWWRIVMKKAYTRWRKTGFEKPICL